MLNIEANRFLRSCQKGSLLSSQQSFLELPRRQILSHLVHNLLVPSFMIFFSPNQDVRVLRQMPLRNSSTLYLFCHLYQPEMWSCQVMTVLFDRTHFHKTNLTDNNTLFVSNLSLMASKLFCSVAKTYVRGAILLGFV